jgi:hypothetical protein
VAFRLTVAILLWALASGCGSTRAIRLDTGQGKPREHPRPTSEQSVEVGKDAFEETLTRWVLQAPLPVLPAQQGGLRRASFSNSGTATRGLHLLRQSFGGLCKPGQRGEDCLPPLENVQDLGSWDKLGVALGLSLEPMKASISEAVKNTFSPQLFYTVIATGLLSWAILAANPEPVFTKAAAMVSAVLLIYLGVETFLELVDASRELSRSARQATTAVALAQAGHHFAERVGPEVSRVAVLAVTVALSHGMTGSASWLASRLPMLPHFSEAAAVGASQAGIHLAHVGQVRAVAVIGDTLTLSLPATAAAMVAKGQQSTAKTGGQQHHLISRRIARALEEHPVLRGHYAERDPRFVTRAADKAAHNGYQRWHRDVDDEVIGWLEKSGRATPEEFEAFLRQLYSRPEMRARFPDGF